MFTLVCLLIKSKHTIFLCKLFYSFVTKAKVKDTLLLCTRTQQPTTHINLKKKKIFFTESF